MSARDQAIHDTVAAIDFHIAELESALGGAYAANEASAQADHAYRLAEATETLKSSLATPAKRRDATVTLATEDIHFARDVAAAHAKSSDQAVRCKMAILSALQSKARLLTGEMGLAR